MGAALEFGQGPFVFVFEKIVISSCDDDCLYKTWQRPTLPRLETKYHWRRGVSRPCSERERVQPPRNDHQVI